MRRSVVRRTARRDVFFSVDRRECLEKVKSVSTVRFAPAGAAGIIYSGEKCVAESRR